MFYKWSFYRRLLKYSSPLIRIFEAGLIKKYGKKKTYLPPVFILGLPRSGTTFLYQILTDLFDVLYFDNLVTLGRENLFFSFWLSKLLFNNRLHNSYSSNYGNTTDDGLHAPSEAGILWYRWIPEDQIIIDENSVTQKDKKSIYRNINSIINRYRKPLVIKNIYFALRIRLIKELFPNAKFIYLKRNPLFIAQSIYIARKKNLKNPKDEWWSLNFPGYKSLLNLPIEKQIAQQVYQLETLINKELSAIPSESIMEIKYEELELEKIEKQFKSFIGAEKRNKFSLEKLDYKTGNIQKIDDEIFSKLKLELEKAYSD